MKVAITIMLPMEFTYRLREVRQKTGVSLGAQVERSLLAYWGNEIRDEVRKDA